jgi:predicted unusual protein kinase regulating ubiquinone biosynthesis (AarF/ABC1/UbiB family)/Zn-dependent protease with chaperone function
MIQGINRESINGVVECSPEISHDEVLDQLHLAFRKRILHPFGKSMVPNRLGEGQFRVPYSASQIASAYQDCKLFRMATDHFPENDPCTKDVRACFERVCEAAGIPGADYKVLIFSTAYPDAHIVPAAQEVRISTGLLELFEYDREEVTAVLAHEVGHVMMGHDEDIDPIHPNVEMDFFREKIGNYEEEYQADRFGTLLLSRLKIRPIRMVGVLKKLYEYQKHKLPEEIKHMTDGIDHENRGFSAWIFNTHPHLPRRMNAINNSIRLLPYEEQGDRDELSQKISKPLKGVAPERQLSWEGEVFEDEADLFTIYRRFYDPFVDEPEGEYLCSSVNNILMQFSGDDPETSHIDSLFKMLSACSLSDDEGELLQKSIIQDPQDVAELDLKDTFGEIVVRPPKMIFHFEGLSAAERRKFFAMCSKYKIWGFSEPANLNFFGLDPESMNALDDTTLREWWESVTRPMRHRQKQAADRGDALSKGPHRHEPKQYYPEPNGNLDFDRDRCKRLLYTAWWGQSMGHVRHLEGFQQLEADLQQYSFEVLNDLLGSFDLMEFRRAAIKPGEDFHADLFHDNPPAPNGCEQSHSLLVKYWLQALTKGQYQLEHAKTVLEFLRQYRMEKGHHLPYGLLRIYDYLIKCTESQPGIQSSFYELIREYSFELRVDSIYKFDPLYDFFKSFKSEAGSSREATHETLLLERAPYRRLSTSLSGTSMKIDLYLTSEISALPDPVKISSQKATIHLDRQVSEDVLITIFFRIVASIFPQYDNNRDHFFQKNLEINKEAFLKTCRHLQSKAAASPADARAFLEVEFFPQVNHESLFKSAKKKGIALNQSHGDRLREIDPSVSARLLSTEEFEEAYFGKGREGYELVAYTCIDDEIPEERAVFILWKLAYGDEFEHMKASTPPLDLVKYVLKTYPKPCSYRDQLLVNCWKREEVRLSTTADTQLVQSILREETDLNLLFLMSRSYSHQLLNLTASARLYSFYQSLGADAFLKSFDASFLAAERKTLSELVAGKAGGEDLFCTLLCYPHSCYKRDELLRPFIDQAQTMSDKQLIAGLFSDPPAGHIQKRQVGMVAFQETIMDALGRLQDLEKAEAMLYLLGQRKFRSGIDEAFSDREETEKSREKRWQYALSNTRSVNNSYDTPDAIIYLSKALGLPVEAIFEQERSVFTRRDQREFIHQLLLEENGVLRSSYRGQFMSRVAILITRQGKFKEMEAQEKEAVKGVLLVAFSECAEEKIADLFLDVWMLSYEETSSVPDLVAKLLQRLGPVFVRAGQYLAHQTSSLPKEWIRAFRRLVNENTVSDSSLLPEYYDIYLGKNPFQQIAEKKGEGSLAAVNRCVDEQGRNCAVKTFHSFIKKELPEDIRLLGKLVDHINAHRELYQITLPLNLSQVVQQKILHEINPVHEREGHARLSSILSRELAGIQFVQPSLISEHSKGMIVTFECMDGVRLDQQEALAKMGISEAQVRSIRHSIGLEIMRQILQHGVYQSDPNVGNFPIDENGRVIWLDFGSIHQLSSEQHQFLMGFIKKIFLADTEGLIEGFVQMVQEPLRTAETSSLVRQWVMTRKDAGQYAVEQLESLISDFQDFCVEKGLVLEECWVSLLTTLGLLKPYLQDIDPALVAETLMPIFFPHS